ncbi:TadE/TadG family type IV pilus assembly protein [Ramlibacter solisilvae]|uniref:Pilus assembly protein TadE n=1 Tax=Ramlibacter tataouinensis TaxID=94132 RepID=A0A127JWQ7_9BURK|nr:TadE/TadG family type IV pilus assembly protein [Ramlibacter tataouinensis]AMO24448.1 pilus assembly protein TadE [Ramlibacter tataouinensis]
MTDQKNQRGAALLELAFVIPILLVITFIVTEFGRAIYQYSALTKSVRDAARYLSIQTPNTKVTEAQNLVVYGTTTAGSTPLVTGLTTAMVSANWPIAPTGTNPPIYTVTVQISGYTFQSTVLSAFGLPFSNVTFSNIRATMRSHTT